MLDGVQIRCQAGCGIREIFRAGYGMKIFWRDRNVLISIDGMRDSFEIDIGMRDFSTISDLLKIYKARSG